MLALKFICLLTLVPPALCDTLTLTSAFCSKGIEVPVQCHTGQTDVQQCVDSMAQVPVGVTCFTEWISVPSQISCNTVALTLEAKDEAVVDTLCEGARYGTEMGMCGTPLTNKTEFPISLQDTYIYIEAPDTCVITFTISKMLEGANTDVYMTEPYVEEGIVRTLCIDTETPGVCEAGQTDVDTCVKALEDLPPGASCHMRHRFKPTETECMRPALTLTQKQSAMVESDTCTHLTYGMKDATSNESLKCVEALSASGLIVPSKDWAETQVWLKAEGCVMTIQVSTHFVGREMLTTESSVWTVSTEATLEDKQETAGAEMVLGFALWSCVIWLSQGV
eukprot:Blabericola_migrator_1__4282@NODE_2313_length_2950_cov_612_657995_g1449_i0_p1_GENE_NODE_2313_length_2950_cov_612_657995_g1449_i0NODE_2313_length_2950_cov_612_657995_g1449_i0_p1_ORF_typecomplete_len336_score79_14ASH/PF15780_5/2_7e03ASH/PF15780_5/6_3e03ASH/PF15780_5/0_014_NODE_2313_length_2950_cov_612_657995_g1449_i017272734